MQSPVHAGAARLLDRPVIRSRRTPVPAPVVPVASRDLWAEMDRLNDAFMAA